MVQSPPVTRQAQGQQGHPHRHQRTCGYGCGGCLLSFILPPASPRLYRHTPSRYDPFLDHQTLSSSSAPHQHLISTSSAPRQHLIGPPHLCPSSVIRTIYWYTLIISAPSHVSLNPPALSGTCPQSPPLKGHLSRNPSQISPLPKSAPSPYL